MQSKQELKTFGIGAFPDLEPGAVLAIVLVLVLVIGARRRPRPRPFRLFSAGND
jgi:hypothetical protein